MDPSCFKFSRPSYDDVFLDESTRPGALPEVYLEDLKHKTRYESMWLRHFERLIT